MFAARRGEAEHRASPRGVPVSNAKTADTAKVSKASTLAAFW